MPDRRCSLLPSDRDERNEIVGAAQWCSCRLFVLGFPPGGQRVRSFLFRGTMDAIHGFGSPGSVFSFVLPAERERENFLPSCTTKTTVDIAHAVLRLHDRFGLVCVRFFDWGVALEEFRFVHVCASSFYLVELSVDFPRCVWVVLLQVSSHARSISANIKALSLSLHRKFQIQACNNGTSPLQRRSWRKLKHKADNSGWQCGTGQQQLPEGFCHKNVSRRRPVSAT